MKKFKYYITFYIFLLPILLFYSSCMTSKPLLNDWAGKQGTGEKIEIVPLKPVPVLNWIEIADRPEPGNFTGEGHVLTVTGLSFSPDGKYIVSSSWDKTIKLWSSSGKLIRTFKKQTKAVSSVAFSPDGNYIISGSWDKTLKLWNVNGNLFREYKGHTNSVNSVAFSPDGKYIISGSSDKTAILWSSEGKPLHVFKGHTKAINCVAFSPDGRYFLTGSDDMTVKLWSIKGNLVRTLTGHRGWIQTAVFSPDGRFIVTGATDKTGKLWSLNGSLIRTLHHSSNVDCVVFSPDGKFIITGSTKSIWMWRADGTNPRIIKSINEYIKSIAVSPDGSYIVSGTGQNYIKQGKTDIMLVMKTASVKDNFLSRFMLEDLLKYTPVTSSRSEAEELNKKGLARHKRKYYEESERLFYLAAKKDSSWVKPFFNLACSASLQKKDDIALAYLEEALKRDIKKAIIWAKNDPDIRFIRHLSGYRELIKKYSD